MHVRTHARSHATNARTLARTLQLPSPLWLHLAPFPPPRAHDDMPSPMRYPQSVSPASGRARGSRAACLPVSIPACHGRNTRNEYVNICINICKYIFLTCAWLLACPTVAALRTPHAQAPSDAPPHAGMRAVHTNLSVLLLRGIRIRILYCGR